MTTSSNRSSGGEILVLILVGLFVGIIGTIGFQRLLPRALEDGDYTLALPSDGALAVKDPNGGKPAFYVVPPEAVNYLVDPGKAWEVHVTARGLYRMVTVYVPTRDFLPKGSVPQPLSAPPPGTNGALLPPGE